MSISKKLFELKREESELLALLDVERARKTILCEACKGFHTINTLTLIQTHWYTQPHGCTEGDYWNIGEMQFVCTKTGIRNRLLFSSIPYDLRGKYIYSAEDQFRRLYTALFKEVKETYSDEPKTPWINNFYVDQHRKKFHLVEKKLVEKASLEK